MYKQQSWWVAIFLVLSTLTSCGGGGVALSPEQEAEKMEDLLIQVVEVDDDFPFLPDSNTAKVLIECSVKVFQSYGVTLEEVETYVEAALLDPDIDDSLIDDVDEEEADARLFSCVAENLSEAEWSALLLMGLAAEE